ncbi:MAG TPA: hypothetical protein VL128_14160 [Candidatus Eisenbacteria bacterium]|nr:hypothetical protein [Candidatus Eisenbacteria bacterium]
MAITIKDTTATSPMLQRMLGSGPGMAPALPNYPAQSVTAIDGVRSALFGLPFLAAGGFIWFMTFHGDPRARHAPVWLIFLVGGIFSSGGLFLFLHGIAGMIRRYVHNRRAAQNPGQPWLSDYHWRAEGIRFSAFQAMMGRLLAALGWYLFLAPFFWVGTHGPWPFLAIASIFGLLGIMFWVRWAQMLGDLLRYGNSFLAYDTFPYFLGGALNARLRAPRHLAVLNSLTLTLRCIQERYITTGTGNNRATRVVCYELYKDVLSFDQQRLANFVGADIPVEFRVPADKLPTTLDDAPPTYWSIEARGEAPGADYEAYFLVPVYKAS